MFAKIAVPLALALLLAGCGSKGTNSGGNVPAEVVKGKKGEIKMTVDEFRAALDVGNKSWNPKKKFYDQFGEPERITDVGDSTYLYYRCKDGAVRVECGKGEFNHMDQIRALGLDRQ